MIANNGGHNVLVVSPQGKLLCKIDVGVAVHGVAVTVCGDIWVSCHNNSSIMLYSGDSSAHKQTLLRTITCKSPWCIAVVPGSDSDDKVNTKRTGGSLVVAMGYAKTVCRFNREGKEMWRTRGPATNDQFGDLYGLVIVDECVYVADADRSRVVVLNTYNGDVLQTFQGSLGMLPRAISFDPVSRVLLVGALTEVQVYTLDGKLIHRLGDKSTPSFKFRYIYGICTGPDGTLFVADWSNNIYMF